MKAVMKALRASGAWDPRPGYTPSAKEAELGRAESGRQVWRHPKFELVEIPVPDVGDTQVLVRVKRCGICGSDSHLYQTDDDGYIMFSGPARLPCILGHEYSGVVEAVGKSVSHIRVGDLVAAESILWCGKCQACRAGLPNQCEQVELAGITADGALAEYALLDQLQCWKIDSLALRYSGDDLFEVAALIEPLGCAYNGMFIHGGGFRPGAVVVVHGAGPIGLGAVAFARIAGASQVIAFDPIAERLEIAKSLGADKIYNTRELAASGVSASSLILAHTGGAGADMQVEAAGAAADTIPQMQASLAANGHIIYLGRAANDTPVQLNTMVTGAHAIVGSRGHAGFGIFPSIIRLLASGRLQVREIITARFHFSEVLAALEQSVTRIDGKVMVRIS